ncbi:MAG: hypothetical protein CM1200mP10_28170 [Candidatus Neomarinimicrobiota bacterium]|nr:MAG: hypothetical protein CM1200mP10_28170 [Candidatus Neomarinimicrobiota bacterium]
MLYSPKGKKGFDILINAFAKLIKKMPDVVLTIVGDGPEKDNLNISRKLNISKRLTLPVPEKTCCGEMLRHHHVLGFLVRGKLFGVALVKR